VGVGGVGTGIVLVHGGSLAGTDTGAATPDRVTPRFRL